MTLEEDDRRRHPRAADLGIAAVVLVRHNPGVTLSIENLSIGGAMLVGELTLSAGELLQILFEVDGSPVEVAAEVVRVDRLDMTHDRIAVRFLGLDDVVSERIQRLICKVIQLEVEQLAEQRSGT
jgi:c-di-GMP-binding flagellar brake protein YcgR